MTVEETRFITDMLRAIRSELRDVRNEQISQGLRITGVEQRLAGMDTHIFALQHSIGTLGDDMRLVKQRLELVEE